MSTARIEAVSQDFQRRPGGGSASANGTPIASPTALERSLSDEGYAMSGFGPRPYRHRLFGFLTPMPRGARIFS